MNFLHETAAGPKKIVRTMLYGDQELSRFELEIIHTQLYQRLYDLKQLGYSDRVFPDAIHSRFNHLLGVAEVATRMAQHLHRWLSHRSRQDYSFDFTDAADQVQSIRGSALATHLATRIPTLRLMALLHDLTHAAFGHTLEDEVSVFTEGHDEPIRQARFFDALTAQLIVLWASELRVQGVDILDLNKINDFEIDQPKILALAQGISAKLAEWQLSENRNAVKELVSHLTELEIALRLLLVLDAAHTPPEEPKDDEKPLEELTRNLRQLSSSELLLSKVIAKIDPKRKPVDINVHRDMFFIDMIGNTICADLIDYARRDSTNAGLKVGFDERILRYLSVVSVKDRFVPGGRPAIRSGIQIFTNKLRNDVLSEMSGLLKTRYLISERITFHPTKCAAGACLGTAVQLLGIRNIPPWVQALGDLSFLDHLRKCASSAESICDEIDGLFSGAARGDTKNKLADLCSSHLGRDPKLEQLVLQTLRNMGCPDEPLQDVSAVIPVRRRIQAARRILLKLAARRYPKLAYRLQDSLRADTELTTEQIAEDYNQPEARYKLERKIEERCYLPMGTVYIHCPVRNTSMKVAHALVVGNNLKKVGRLRTVTKIYGGLDDLKPYQDEIQSIESMYKSIWRFHIYLDTAYSDRVAVVKAVAHQELRFPANALMNNGEDDAPAIQENVFSRLMMSHHQGKYAPDHLPLIIKELDEVHTRFRNTPDTSIDAADAIIVDAIERVNKEIVNQQNLAEMARTSVGQKPGKKGSL